MKVPITEIRVKDGRRSLDTGHVKELADSIRELGLLNPVTVDRGNVLIAGLHRLEAVRMLGWAEVECTVSSLEGLAAELAEIDENFVRNGLSAVEYGEMLLRRKEIYETLHPETKHGGDRKSGGIKRTKCPLDPVKSFVDDTAEKLHVTPRTVRRQIQTARDLTPGTKEIMKNADAGISKKAALKLSRLEPGQQEEAAALLAAKEIRTVDEYTEKKAGEAMQGTCCEEPHETHVPPQQEVPPKGHGTSLKDVILELKDMDKDCSGTPGSFLEEYGAFVKKFHKEIGWYSDPYYDTVFPQISPGQLSILREMTDAICAAAEQLFHKVEERIRKT